MRQYPHRFRKFDIDLTEMGNIDSFGDSVGFFVEVDGTDFIFSVLHSSDSIILVNYKKMVVSIFHDNKSALSYPFINFVIGKVFSVIGYASDKTIKIMNFEKYV